MQFYMKMFRKFNFNVYNYIKYKTIVLKITLITVRNKYKLIFISIN